jgi:acyl-CoA synthetase (AMP-forming)/AMP-acid ligase II
VLSIFASKCRWTGTNPAYKADELEHHFRTSNTKYVIASPETIDEVTTAAAALGNTIEVILFTDILSSQVKINGDFNGAPSPAATDKPTFRTLHDLYNRRNISICLADRLRKVGPCDIAALMSTSGTTGLPKMAQRTHLAMISETKANEDNNACKPYEVRRLMCTPIFHAFSTPEMIFNPLRLGYPTYIAKRFDSSFAQMVHDYQITETAAPPPMLLALVNRAQDHHLLQSLRTIYSGGAPLSAGLRDQTRNIFTNPPRIAQVWGMTEGGWFTTFKYPEDDTTGSVGRMTPGYEVKTTPEHATQLENGQTVGELYVRGPQLMTGYRDNDAATAATFAPDGWLKTGDIGYVRDDGKVYLVDRAKDLIKMNAWQVAPAELEAALASSPDVSDAAAVGVGSGVDEHPLICVVPAHAQVSVRDVVQHLYRGLANYKVSKAEVVFVDSIPKNASGKILRKALKELVGRA